MKIEIVLTAGAVIVIIALLYALVMEFKKWVEANFVILAILLVAVVIGGLFIYAATRNGSYY